MSRKTVEKKILPEYFEAVIRDEKHFEIRKDEDNLHVGDAIILKEFDGKNFTGRATGRNITYILRNCPEHGLMEGFCIIGW